MVCLPCEPSNWEIGGEEKRRCRGRRRAESRGGGGKENTSLPRFPPFLPTPLPLRMVIILSAQDPPGVSEDAIANWQLRVFGTMARNEQDEITTGTGY